MQINIEQLTLNINLPMEHLTECWMGKCPFGDSICCYECDAKCIDRCTDDECRRNCIKRRLKKHG